jgi:hypothetical protein
MHRINHRGAYSFDGDISIPTTPNIYTNNAEPFFSRMRENRFLFRKNRRERSQNHRLIRERRIKEDYPASSG